MSSLGMALPCQQKKPGMRAHAILAVFACSVVACKAQPTVLMIGDSSGSYAGQSLEDFCEGVAVRNHAIGGTETGNWRSTEINDAILGCSSYTHVWIGLGGNDVFTSAGCNLAQATLESRLQRVVDDVISAMGASVKIFATGYCVPDSNAGNCPDDATMLSAAAMIQDAWTAIAAANPSVSFFDGALACDAPSTSSFSPGTHHVDAIHANNKGYCRTWTMPALQTYLGCGVVSYDCDSVATSPDGGVRGGNADNIDPRPTSCPTASTSPSDPASSPTPIPPFAFNPCHPSTSVVKMADGRSVRLDSLREGDRIVAARADGTLTTDEVSLLSVARPGVPAAFLRIATQGGHALNITSEHHLPVGAVCCGHLRKAKDMAVGETIWVVEGAATVARTVVQVGHTVAHGLHSPVLASGTFPVVDGVVTAFDRIESVTLAAYSLPPLLRACKATGTCSVVQRLHSLFSGRELSTYIAPRGVPEE